MAPYLRGYPFIYKNMDPVDKFHVTKLRKISFLSNYTKNFVVLPFLVTVYFPHAIGRKILKVILHDITDEHPIQGKLLQRP